MLKTKASKTWTGLRVMVTVLCVSLSPQMIRAGYNDVTPVINSEATRGLSTVSSAESMGAGRLTFSVSGNWYEQNQAFVLAPNKNANIVNGLGAASYGASPYIDLFASVGAFGSSHYTNTNRSGGWGSVKAGVQGTLPYPEKSMMHLGGQAALIGGTSNNQINTNRADGYNYFQTRTGTDFMAKLLQSVCLGSESHSIKLHLNEGAVQSLRGQNAALLLLGAGLQGNLFSFAAIGVELNSRTQMNDWAFRTDPLWITPSVQFRSSYNTNISAGLDVSLSRNRSNAEPRALEPYRVFGAVAFSFDMLASKRRAEFARKQKAAQEKAALEHKAAQSAKQVDSLTMKSADDSFALADEKENGLYQMDSMQRKADDLARANKATAAVLATKATTDSLALIQAASNLAEEKEKRSDAEKRLLSTGELLLDAVYFETGKTILTINSKPYLNIIGKMLLKYPKLQIEVAGHTDNVGGIDYNIGLSQGRAQAVRDYLIVVSPALNSTLSARGYGMSMPKADNTTTDGRTANRRVELRVTNRDALLEYSQL
jgi:outer membrane protein OmpA-like peptidoglycan-associated protein